MPPGSISTQSQSDFGTKDQPRSVRGSVLHVGSSFFCVLHFLVAKLPSSLVEKSVKPGNGAVLPNRSAAHPSECFAITSEFNCLPVDKVVRQTRSFASPSQCVWIATSHYALRETDRKTVMAGKNSINGGPPSSKAEAGKERSVLDDLFSITYEELRRLAFSVRRGDPSATLTPTALVNEAWLKLAKSPAIGTQSKLHFKRIAARAMRQLLVEAARRRNAGKRGGPELTVILDESWHSRPSRGKDLLALDSALDDLARMNPRQAVMVESRFFAGLDISETAALLNISEATVLRDWRAAKAWLANELRQT